MLLEIALALVLGAVIYHYIFKKKEETLQMEDGWWGAGEEPETEEEKTVRPFKIEASEEMLKDLHAPIDLTRWTAPLEDIRFHYGFNLTYLQKVASYWRNQYSWQKQVEILNKYPHFKTNIEGIDIHFIHVKPPHLPAGRTAKPLLIVHGWPGSFYEFYKIISLLTDPSSHGLSDEHIFEVICPSIPGFGFSEAPHKKGCDSVAVARIFYKLMMRLGFREFYAQGGDWGSLICTNLSQLVPSHVIGLHLNVVFLAPGAPQFLAILFRKYFLGLFGLRELYVQQMFPYTEKVLYPMVKESGYLHIQATKPDTAGFGLISSLVGLAAYILEKLSTWTDAEFCNLEDGGLERNYSLDELLTNIMIYWVSGSIISSMRFYKENLGDGLGHRKHERVKVKVPTGVASFPNELRHAPPVWAEKKYTNIVSFADMPHGGHFAAFEQPEILAADIRQFVGKVERK
ncbi:epoxide hydrolase 1-like isoform X1 [Lissotriton helveticus]